MHRDVVVRLRRLEGRVPVPAPVWQPRVQTPAESWATIAVLVAAGALPALDDEAGLLAALLNLRGLP